MSTHQGDAARTDGETVPEPAAPSPAASLDAVGAEAGLTPSEDAAELSAADEAKRRFREALDRKKGAAHPDDVKKGGSKARGTSSAHAHREFRRKSG
jgi:hypothetical protein